MTASAAGKLEGFTSDLTVDEFILLTDAGWEAVAFVAGDCTSAAGDGHWSVSGNQGDALTRGQSTAMERMRHQAAEVGAAGVVGIRLKTTEVELGKEAPPAFHFAVLGTAIRPVGKTSRREASPFTSHLSGQDTWALLGAGCQPLGMVFGVGFYRPKILSRPPKGFKEVSYLTEGIYAARERAMRSMQSQASALHASGVVGVTVDMTISHRHNVTFTAIGTAIATPAKRPDDPGPRLAVGLADHPEITRTEHQLPLHGRPASARTERWGEPVM